MYAEERQQIILERARVKGRVDVTALADEFSAYIATSYPRVVHVTLCCFLSGRNVMAWLSHGAAATRGSGNLALSGRLRPLGRACTG